MSDCGYASTTITFHAMFTICRQKLKAQIVHLPVLYCFLTRVLCFGLSFTIDHIIDMNFVKAFGIFVFIIQLHNGKLNNNLQFTMNTHCSVSNLDVPKQKKSLHTLILQLVAEKRIVFRLLIAEIW